MRVIAVFLLAAALLAGGASAQDDDGHSAGGDYYAAGDNPQVRQPLARDAFIAGFNSTVSAPVEGDVHAAGYSVTIAAPVGGDVYAFANNVTISAGVGSDLTAAAARIVIQGTEPIGGNARLGAGSIDISAPVTGSVMAGGGTLQLNSTIGGDLIFSGGALGFGDGAHVAGNLVLRSSDPIEVPASVAPPERVSVESTSPANPAQRTINSTWSLVLGGLIFVIVCGIAGLIWMAASRQGSLQAEAAAALHPWRSLLAGAMALGVLIGSIPLLAMTIVGLLLVPIAIVVLALAWIVGTAAGAYFVGARLMDASRRPVVTFGTRFSVMIVSLALLWLIGLIPVVGWLIMLLTVTFGLGGITLERWWRAPPAVPGRTAPRDPASVAG